MRRPPVRISEPVYVHGEGDLPCDYLLIGERPGYQEAMTGRPFVGPAGRELSRFIARDEWYIDNLVPTYTGSNDDKPTPDDLASWSPRLERLIRRCRPRLVVTTGLYSTRYFLGEWATMELCHGLVHEAPARSFPVLPVYHPAAALHQPERYQWALRQDFEAVRAAMTGTVEPHERLSDSEDSFTSAHSALDDMPTGAVLAIDREGDANAPECFTASYRDREGILVYTSDRAGIRALSRAVARSSLVILHAALDDLRSLARVGIAVPDDRWIDTLILAYLAGEPRGLKTLGYRLRGRVMHEYSDLVNPIDDAWVRAALVRARRRFRTRHVALGVPKRALTSIRGMLRKDTNDSLRKRWSNSTFAPHVRLPAPPTWKDIDPAIGVPYACVDAIETRQIYRPLTRRVAALGLDSLYQIDAGIVPFLARIADRGLKVDRSVLDALAATFTAEYDRTVKRIERLVGHPLNPLSPTKVSDTLFDDLGVTVTKPSKDRRHFRTGDKYLKARQTEHAVIPLIMEAREISKMRGTYAERLPTLLREGRYHPDFQYCATPTARLTEECIVLIPKHTARGKQIRKAFVADEGNVLLSTDASQIEMRVMAHESQDAVLLAVYRRGGDVHADTAYHLLGAPKNPANQDESRHRLPAKTLNFGVLNAMTEIGLSEQLQSHGLPGWDVEACRDFLNGWWRLHTGVAGYRTRQVNHGKRYGYITDLYGRRIFVAGLHSKDEMIRMREERRCLSGIQSGAQGLMRKWIAAIWREIFCAGRYPPAPTGYIEPWCFLHDDVLIECTEAWAMLVAEKMHTLLPQDLCIPVTGESKIGRDWATLYKLADWKAAAD
jgi:uracil-DNA glycosylase family 4